MPRKLSAPIREQFLTLPQAARKLGVHYMTLYGWARAGKLPVFRVSPKLFLVDWAQVVTLIERYRVRPEDLPRRSAADLGRATPVTKKKWGVPHATRRLRAGS